MSFANTGVKHACITMADVGARAVHTGLHTLRAQALRVGTAAYSRSLDVFTKDISIISSNLFGGDLGKAVAKAATASRNYKALGDCFVLSGLSRVRPPRSMKRKASTSPPFRWYSRHSQGQASQTRRFKKRSRGSRRKGMGTDQQSGKPKQPQWQHPKHGNKPKPKASNHKGKKGYNS